MKKIFTILALSSLLLASPIMAKSNHNKKQLVFHVIKESMVINKQDVRSVKLVKRADHNYLVEISLTPEAAKRLSQLTGSSIHQQMMMTIGKHIINKATIQSKLGTNFQISTASKSLAKSIVKDLSKQ